MIYLTFDTNIWIYSLDDSWKLDNHLDYIETWIEENQVEILLPEIILSEWENNKKDQIDERKKKLKLFFEMADDILPSSFFDEYKSEESQNAIINAQVDRIYEILKKSVVIPTTKKIHEKVVLWGINKKAPLHTKSSIADAVIVISLFEFAEQNPENNYFFVSNNKKDFYEGNKVHKDLRPQFEKYNIQAYKTIENLVNNLKYEHKLPESQQIYFKRKNRSKNRLKESAYNPE